MKNVYLMSLFALLVFLPSVGISERWTELYYYDNETRTFKEITWTYIINPDGSVSLGDAPEGALRYSHRIDDVTQLILSPVSLPSSINGSLVSAISPMAFASFQGGGGYSEDVYSLRSVVVPSSIKRIGKYAFTNNPKLTSITLGSGLTAIDDGAFEYCVGLLSITIPDGVTRLSRHTFKDCIRLQSVRLPATLTSIGEGTFQNNESLTGISFPATLTTIDENAFLDCTALQTLTIPPGVQKIGSSAFEGCSQLNTLILEEGVSGIEIRAFANCSSLKDVAIPSSLSRVGNGLFQNCTSMASLVFADGVDAIGAMAFSGCSSLSSLVLPESLSIIEFEAFKGCRLLTELVFPKELKRIGSSAFYGCNKLERIVIPAATRSIGAKAFGNCGEVALVKFEGAPPRVEGTNVFSGGVGTYPNKLKEDWAKVFNKDGEWQNLEMKPYYTVTIQETEGGTVEGGGDFLKGESVKLVVTPDAGYVFCGWDAPVEINNFIFDMPAKDVEVRALFAKKDAIDNYVSTFSVITEEKAFSTITNRVAELELVTKEEAVSNAVAKQEVFDEAGMIEQAAEAPVMTVKDDVVEIYISLEYAKTLDSWEAMDLQEATLEVDEAAGLLKVKVPRNNVDAAFYRFVVTEGAEE